MAKSSKTYYREDKRVTLKPNLPFHSQAYSILGGGGEGKKACRRRQLITRKEAGSYGVLGSHLTRF